MPMTTFRERMVGPVGPVSGTRWTVARRGRHAADGVARVAAGTAGARPGRLDLDRLRVAVLGVDPDRDGYRALLTSGRVAGLVDHPVPLDCGFADLLTAADGGRRMHYRALVLVGADAYVIEGVKVVTGGLRTAWRSTTTLHTLVVRIDPAVTVPLHAVDRARWVEAGDVPGEVVLAGVLRVRGLASQGLSLRGSVARFLVGFLRRSVRP